MMNEGKQERREDSTTQQCEDDTPPPIGITSQEFLDRVWAFMAKELER